MLGANFRAHHPSPQPSLPSATELPRIVPQLPPFVVVCQLGQLAQHSLTRRGAQVAEEAGPGHDGQGGRRQLVWGGLVSR